MVLDAHCDTDVPRCMVDEPVGDFVPVDKLLESLHFIPSRRTSRTTVGMRVSASRQPSGMALPQIIEDGLDPRAHLHRALRLPHPYQRDPTCFKPVEYALKHSPSDCKSLDATRCMVVNLIIELVAVCTKENKILIDTIDPNVKRVLESGNMCKQVVAMRELQYIYGLPDWGAVPYLLTGLPLLGASDPVCGMMPRTVQASCSTADFTATHTEQCERVLRRVVPSGDVELDARAYKKSVDEHKRGVLLGPFRTLSEVPVVEPCLVPRHGLWEQHGDADEPTVRVIDDLLMGGQNETVSYSSTHRPADGDALCSHQRSLQERFPLAPTAGWTSDFAKAFKQIPHAPWQMKYVVIAQWCPEEMCIHFWLALSQLFGGRSAPQNFSRYPAWFCFLLAQSLCVPVQHCVDDMLGMERQDTVWSGWHGWRSIADVLGWDVPDVKSPPPSQAYLAVGYFMNHVGTPGRLARLSLSIRRLDMLVQIIHIALVNDDLGGAAAGSLFGRLGFALNAVQGRFGRALMRAIKRRQYEKRSNLNPQLRASLRWWSRFLQSHTPRSIPVSLRDRQIVVSYSDGEGSGGVGVAVWLPDGSRPRAAFMKIPWLLRRLWSAQMARSFIGNDQRDIYEIEAIGPLICLDLWPSLFQDVLWLHFIDNAAAQAALTRGSSSVQSGDAIVSLTWKRIVAARCLPWFDRVESKANPVDGLSRGDMTGDWLSVEEARIPKGLLPAIKDELEQSGWSG